MSSNLGDFVAEYKVSKTFLIITVFGALMLADGGVFVLLLPGMIAGNPECQ